MDTYTKLYWLTRLDGIGTFFAIISIMSIIAIGGIILWVFTSPECDTDYCDEDKVKSRRKLAWRYVYLFIATGMVFGILGVLTPTKDEVIFIIAGGKTIDWAKSDTSINKIPSQTTKLISKFLEEQLKETNNDQSK